MEHDCLLCEINPLAVDGTGALVAVDAKAAIDDSALGKYPDILALRDRLEREPRVLEARQYRFLYIPCDPAGNLAVISNGSGMIMSCIDVLGANGMVVHSALDLGGGSTADRIKEAVRIVLGEDRIKGLFINIFGGITRCDEAANGVRRFMAEHESDKLIVVRFEGTNKDQGLEILSSIARDNVIFADGLHQGVRALAERKERL
jgi:succinyl-CoA synthetase beta subunit